MKDELTLTLIQHAEDLAADPYTENQVNDILLAAGYPHKLRDVVNAMEYAGPPPPDEGYLRWEDAVVDRLYG